MASKAARNATLRSSGTPGEVKYGRPSPCPASSATSADVAREAGVSRATVSYVLNDVPHQKIPQSTRQRILDAAYRLGYAPSAAARAW